MVYVNKLNVCHYVKNIDSSRNIAERNTKIVRNCNKHIDSPYNSVLKPLKGDFSLN